MLQANIMNGVTSVTLHRRLKALKADLCNSLAPSRLDQHGLAAARGRENQPLAFDGLPDVVFTSRDEQYHCILISIQWRVSLFS